MTRIDNEMAHNGDRKEKSTGLNMKAMQVDTWCRETSVIEGCGGRGDSILLLLLL